MLYDNPPIYTIYGVTVFPDHDEESLQFYYMPMSPHVSGEVRTDGNGKDLFVPDVQLIMYTGSAGKGGFFNLDVDIGVPEDHLEKVRNKLKSLRGLRDVPILAPVPLTEGTVTMTLFGETSGATTPNQAKFVQKFSCAAKPALFGANRASFSATLDADGAALIHRLMDPKSGPPQDMSPVSIAYSLSYLALRPAYHAHIEANWEQVQARLAEKFQYSGLLFSADIDTTVDEMLNSREGEKILKVDTFIPEDGDDSGVMARRDAAIEELKEMITKTFFEPVANPRVEQPPDMADKVYDKLVRGGIAIASMGVSEVLGTFKFKKINFKTTDTRSLNGDISERTTVLRSINPQGHLNWAFDNLRNRGVDLKPFIKFADLDDPFFRERKIKVRSGADFTADSIRCIDVALNYANDPRSVSLESTTATAERTWSSDVQDGVMQRAVAVSYTVSFKDADGLARPRSIRSESWVTEDETVTIDPSDMYSFMEVPIEADEDFPWDRYPRLRIETRYIDEPHSIRNEPVFELDSKNSRKIWKIFQRDMQERRFQYRVTYLARNRSQNRETAWYSSDKSRIDIEDPMHGKVQKIIRVASFDWTKTSQVIIDVKYEDRANKVKEEQSFTFEEANKTKSQTFVYFPMDVPDKDLVSYEVTIINEDDVIEIPRSETTDKGIIVKPDSKANRRIQVRIAPAAFDDKNLQQATVKMEYRDKDNDISAHDEFVFHSVADEYIFAFNYVSEKKKRYRYAVEYQNSDGFPSSRDWVETADERLTVPAVSK